MTCALAFAIFCGLGCVLGLGQAFALLLGADIRLRTIKRGEGQPYLMRWTRGEQSDARRAADEASGAWRIRLHHFVAPDNAGHHNHPFKWAFSIVLWGGYIEEVLNPGAGRIRLRHIRWFNWIPAEKYHRIIRLQRGLFGLGTWTLFFTGPRVQGWGFWVPGRGNVPWKQYHAERGETNEGTQQ